MSHCKLKLLKRLSKNYQSTRCITVCCIAADQRGCPCCPLPKVATMGHVSIRTRQWIRVVWSGELHFLLHHMSGKVCVHHLWEHIAPRGTMGRRRAGGGSVMLWACWETLGPAIHGVDVSLTCTTHPDCWRPCTPFHRNGIPWWQWSLSVG